MKGNLSIKSCVGVGGKNRWKISRMKSGAELHARACEIDDGGVGG